ncbi:hypothetical protein TVAG_273610 [Trichomonas vaginalis G3]|uniref:Ankyrin repeat protein n=1 Tax=Trichomonas vaginalis (strain ATCC PRA-98 / G3) TaxID=412133 RepID=A2EI38_TRIV3|nr:Ankyrin repeat family [Trichomonas vaginalis G3]EAY07677.1 hypothetical protein TVAG_273610 [Trichomonas vaginalis G3]KAI5518522.1 Ankyrin repeat family [Trichomonas vaginalis G3]|eukprot:XP_001319900.1 hypothetical protein [Trichomonas vaginalis G3]
MALVIKDVKFAEILISHGADVNSLNKFGMTPLDYVIILERTEDDTHLDILEDLIKLRHLLISHGGKTLSTRKEVLEKSSNNLTNLSTSVYNEYF